MTLPASTARRAAPILASLAAAGLLAAGCSAPGMGGFQDAMGRQAGEAMGQQLFGGGDGGGSASSGSGAGGSGWGMAGGEAEEGEIFVHRPGGGGTMVSSYPYDSRETGKDWFLQTVVGGQGQQHLFVQAPRSSETQIAELTLTDSAGTTTLRVRNSAAKSCASGEGCQYLARAVAGITEGQLRALTSGGGTLTLAFADGSSTEIAVAAAEVQAYLDTLESERAGGMGS